MQRAQDFIRKNWVILSIVAAVLLVLALGLGMKYSWSFSSASDEEDAMVKTDRSVSTLLSEGNVPEGTSTQEGTDERITVDDQVAGKSVEVRAMHIVVPSWIAIRDDKSILGASWFPAGTTEGTVKLIRAMEGGMEYRAVIYHDDGDKQFEMRGDALVTGVGGAPIGDSFTTSWATPR